MNSDMVRPSGIEFLITVRTSSRVGIGIGPAGGEAAPARDGMPAVGAGDAVREGMPDAPAPLPECFSLSLRAVESDMVPTSLSDPAAARILGFWFEGVSGRDIDRAESRCFIFGFLRVDVSVPEPASDRLGVPGRFRLLLPSRSLRMPDFSLRPEGVVAPDGGAGWACPGSRFLSFSSAARRSFSSSSSSSDCVHVSHNPASRWAQATHRRRVLGVTGMVVVMLMLLQ